MSASMTPIHFYFDYSSPFAYLASTQVEALAARTSARVDYRPFLLGGLFRTIGTPNVPLFDMPAPKRDYFVADAYRWAETWGVPFRYPSRFPMNTVKPLRMTLALPVPARPALVHRLFRAYWVEDRDLADDATLALLANDAGADGAALLERVVDPALKAMLLAATDEACDRGLCGAPTFVVGTDLFWGQDRMAFVEARLGGDRGRPAP